jgi:RES domain-containing protein
MRVWRICKRQHVAFNGEGAWLAGGHWNNPAVPVIYTSASLSLAALELLLHLGQWDIPGDMVAVAADIPDSVAMMKFVNENVPERHWRRYPPLESLGDPVRRWVEKQDTAVLHVPSAIIPTERNYLLNPAHPEFRKIQVGAPQPFSLGLVAPR